MVWWYLIVMPVLPSPVDFIMQAVLERHAGLCKHVFSPQQSWRPWLPHQLLLEAPRWTLPLSNSADLTKGPPYQQWDYHESSLFQHLTALKELRSGLSGRQAFDGPFLGLIRMLSGIV